MPTSSRRRAFKPAHELFVYAGKNARQNRILLAADEAVRLAALDDAACALFLARKFASSRSIDPESRSRLLLVASCLGDDEDRRRAESVAAEFAAPRQSRGPDRSRCRVFPRRGTILARG